LDQDLGHKEAALVMGVSPGRVSQIYAKAILHLQAALAVKFV
jgi:DNA-directed RNA polymerase specialized sigma subunit